MRVPARLLTLLPAALLILAIAPVSAAIDDPSTPGALRVQQPDGVIVELPLRHTKVAIEVTAFVARATIEQVFSNPFNDPVEAVYTFPLGDRASIEVNSTSEPIHMKVVSGFGRGEIVVRFGTDIPYLDAWGQAMLFGPGSIHDAHTSHEYILKRDLIEAVDVYAALVKALLK